MADKKEKMRTLLSALIVMALWGSLFPFIKIGYAAFSIDTASVADILMFAALRFTVCGAIVCGIAAIKKEPVQQPRAKSVTMITLMGVFAIVLHYACTYVGLSMTDSSKTALLKQLGVLLYVCFAFLFFKDETFRVGKLIGALVGFGGIIAINAGGGTIRFTLGDVLIILASVCTVVSNVMSKKSVEGNSPFWVTGISQLTGGLILLAIGFAMGGRLPVFTWQAALVFGSICTASIVSYTLWYAVQRRADLSGLFIIKFAEPLFACAFGAILLGEDIFKWQYLAAFVLISGGIVIANLQSKKSA